MLLRIEIHPGLLLVGMDLCGTAILPLPLAAQEAWMSITALHRIAARLRFWINVQEYVWAAAGDRQR